MGLVSLLIKDISNSTINKYIYYNPIEIWVKEINKIFTNEGISINNHIEMCNIISNQRNIN